MDLLAGHGPLAFGMPDGPDMMILAILVLVLFGAKKLPRFFNSLGRSMGEFRRAKEEFERELREAMDEDALPEDPHAATNRFLGMIFLFCLLMLIVSIVRQVIRH